MEKPLEIAFKGVPRTPQVDEVIDAGIEGLEVTGARITTCDIAVELPHRSHRTGNTYRVRLDVRIPGIEILVNRAPSRTAAETPEAAIADAFKTARSRLLHQIEKRRDARRPRE